MPGSVPEHERIDDLPMYGQPEIPRPEFLQEADRQFTQDATERVGGREQASHLWATEAENHMKEGNLHFAMRRYNQAWLLDPNNYKPYWGFGRITLERDQFDESIRFFEKAKTLCGDDFQKAALLADSGTAYSFKADSLSVSNPERRRFFDLANQDFERSLSLDQGYANGWRRWALSLCREGDFTAARQKAEQAQRLNAPPLPEACLSSN